MDYEVVIGLEVHSELATASKIYCSCSTKFGSEPNTNVCPICTGMPGVLPVLNKKVIEYAVKAGLALDCSITKEGKQDRKNYFYPDLPKAYQTSQFDLPICKEGKVEIVLDEYKKEIGITRIHIEEDAGKLVHDEWGSGTLIDYNRCGVPLVEIVTEPDFRTAEEVKVFFEDLKAILEYLEVSDCKMQEGSLRCDVNLSVRKKGAKEFGTRTETKNLNSIKAIVRSIDYETKRQIETIESGGKIYQETRRWDDDKGLGYAMRSKEEAHDYRYFPEPDLVPIVISDKYIEDIKNNMPELPNERKIRYIKDYNLPEYDAKLITKYKSLSDLFDECINENVDPKTISNWIMVELFRQLNNKNIEPENMPISAKRFAKLLKLIKDGTISNNIAKKVLGFMFDIDDSPEKIIKDKGLIQISDESQLLKIVETVISENPQSVEDYIAGKKKAVGFLMGQSMKATKGQANPQVINKIIIKTLEKMK